MTDEELTILIRQVANNVETSGTTDSLSELVKPLSDAGIASNIHVGTDPKDFTTRMMLEWYAGSIINIAEEKAYFAVNSWLNCVDKFSPIKRSH